MTANAFPSGQLTSSGAAVFAFERSQMLAGKPARYIMVDEAPYNPTPETQYIGQLPGDLDGATKPPAGTPNIIAEVDDPIRDSADSAGHRLRHAPVEVPRRLVEPVEVHVRRQRPAQLHAPGRAVRAAAMRLRLRAELRPAAGRPADARRARRPADVPAVVPAVRRPRLAARQPHGRRLAEHRRPLVRGAPPEDGARDDLPAGDVRAGRRHWRWMGSVAMDNDGNIGLGYSASGPSTLRRCATPAAPRPIRSGR